MSGNPNLSQTLLQALDTFNDAKENPFTGLGIYLRPEDGIIVLKIMDYLDRSGTPYPEKEKFVKDIATYSEISGNHLYLIGEGTLYSKSSVRTNYEFVKIYTRNQFIPIYWQNLFGFQ